MAIRAQWADTIFLSESAWLRRHNALRDWRLVCDEGTFHRPDGTCRNKWRVYILLEDGLFNIFLKEDPHSRAVTIAFDFEEVPLTWQEWHRSKKLEGWQFCDLDKEPWDVINLLDIVNVWRPLLRYDLAANGAGERWWWVSAIKHLHRARKLREACTEAAEEFLNFIYTSDANPRDENGRRWDNIDAQTRSDIRAGRLP